MSFSEKEAIVQYDRDFFIACLQLKKGKITLKEIKSLMPEGAIFNINHKDDLSLLHMCTHGEDFLKKDLNGIVEGGLELLMDITHPDSFHYTFPEFLHFQKFGEKHRPFVRFQKVRSSKSENFTTMRTTVIKSKEHNGLLTMHNPIEKIKNPKSIKSYKDKEIEFVHHNYHKFYRLTEREKHLLQLLGDGVRPIHIAQQLFTSYSNIRKQVKSINEKLELTKSTFNKAAIYAKYAIYFAL